MKDHYLTYNPVQLAEDDTFIQWVKDGRPQHNPWAAWLIEHPEKEADVSEASDLIELIKIKSNPAPNLKVDAIWDRINDSIENEIPESTIEDKVVQMPRRNVFKLIGYAAAACISALLIFQVFSNDDQRIYADYGQQISHVLPDNSEIELNADTKINYDESNWDTERTLSLNGEAYFKVEKGQKFSVLTDHGTVTVLGTSFNIYSREDGFNVHCTTGRVQVKSNNESIVLTPGVKTSLTPSGQLIKEVLPENTQVDWMNKIYKFDKIPLDVVFAALGRQFDVVVTMDAGIGERLYTGSFEATELEKALNVICYPMQLSPIIQGQNIRIQSNVGN